MYNECKKSIYDHQEPKGEQTVFSPFFNIYIWGGGGGGGDNLCFPHFFFLMCMPEVILSVKIKI